MPVFEISKESIKHNIEKIKGIVGNSSIIGVCKSNGYGMGIVPFANALLEYGVDYIAVSRIEEAVILRESGLDCEIILLSSTEIMEEVAEIVKLGLTASAGSVNALIALDNAAKQQKTNVTVHLLFDTGFSYSGFSLNDVNTVANTINSCDFVEVTGCYTHLYASFAKSEKYTKEQFDLFFKIISELKIAGITPSMCHIANTCGALRFPYLHMDAVRIGSGLIGRLQIYNKYGLKKVGVLSSKIVEIKHIDANHNVGYGASFKTKRTCKAAIIPVGYTDGFCMEKSKDSYRFVDALRYKLNIFKNFIKRKKYTCTINGVQVKLLGHIGLTHCIADVSKIDCKVGDTAYFDLNPLYMDSGIERKYV